MKITHVAIRRGITVLMIYLIAVGFGLFSLARLNLDLYPKLEFPLIAIITQYSGVGPRDIETVVTRPIEEAVASVKNVEKVTSTSSQGLSLVLLEFDWDTDIDQAKIDVKDNLDFVKGMLPDDITEPMIFAFDPSVQPVMYLTLESDMHGQAELRRISENDIEPRLERIPGVAAASTYGGMRREIKVLADPGKLRAANLTLQHLIGALQTNNQQIPSGWIESPRQEFTIQTMGEYASLDQIENTALSTHHARPVLVKDVATVLDGFAEQRQKVWSNNKPAVFLLIQKQSDANTVNVSRAVNDRLPLIESQLPKGVRIETFYDAATFINQSMANLGSTAVQAVGLTLLVLLIFLRNLRSSLIVALSIPVSMVTTFAIMDQTGLTLNIVSMAGLALAVGMLVDNSIVVLESIFRHRQELREDAEDAAYNGTNEVAMAVTASTLTTLAVFVPVLFVPGIAGELFNEMVVTICFSLSISLVVALTLTPLLASRFLQMKEMASRVHLLARTSESIGRSLAALHAWYQRVLRWSIGHPKTVLFSNLGLFAVSVIGVANMGGEFLPESDMGYISMTADRSPGTSLKSMEGTTRQINTIIQEEVPEAAAVFSNFGQGEGIMAMFSSRASNEGDITIRLKNRSERSRSMFAAQDVLRERFKTVPDVDVKFEDRGATALFGSGGDISVEIFGHDLEQSELLAEEVQSRLQGLEGIVHMESSLRQSTPELRIALDRRQIGDLGLSTSQISQSVSSSILGTVATRYRDQGDEYDVRVQLTEEARANKEDLDNVMIMTPQGDQIPLRAVATIEYASAPREIARQDQERIVTVNIDVSGRDLQSVTADVAERLQAITLPNDFRLEIGGVAEEQQESFLYLGIAMIVAIVLTYMVMASQFESLIDPLVIIFTIPLSFIGAAFGLILTGTSLNVMALVGVVMLVGIIVNNGIVLVDCINQLRAKGLDIVAAIVEGGRIRLRPVLMTALTTIVAMLPLALGLGESGENWAPMARAVMGGMTLGTALTLVVVPVIYMGADRGWEKLKVRFAPKSQSR